MIDPILLKGFRDSLPKEEKAKKKIERKLEDIFSLYGFQPIDTPVLEYESVLLGKGGGETDKQIFHFEDNGGRKVAMRFDLTVPFARFLALHYSELSFPFKRYHIAKAWRGENPQKGRYREFIQCDFDIVGVDSAEADVEILSLMNASFKTLGIDDVVFHIAHRGLFNDFLEKEGIKERSVEILRVVDKLRKIGKEGVIEQLLPLLPSAESADRIISYITLGDRKNIDDAYSSIVSLLGEETENALRMKRIIELLGALGIKDKFVLDTSITRGLDYYTGIVYETFLSSMEAIGSVCSGGRYNNLASLYTKENLPGVGASIGLDRLMAALEELKSPLVSEIPTSKVVIYFRKDEGNKALLTASGLRKEGISTDVYLFEGKKMKTLFDYASKNGNKFLITFQDDGKMQVKNLETREFTICDRTEEVIAICQ